MISTTGPHCQYQSLDPIQKAVELTGRLQTRATNQETINIGLLAQLDAVLLADTSTIDDSGLLRRLSANLLLQPVANGSVDLLCLLGAGNLAGTDSPDWLVGNDNLAPVLDLVGDSAELRGNDLDGLVGLALLERLTTAQNNTESTVKRGLGLGGNEGVVFLENYAALGVTEEGPGDVAVLELVDGDLTGEGTVGLVEDVLSGDLEAWVKVLAGEEKVEGWRGDNNLCGGISGGRLRSGRRWDDKPVFLSSLASLIPAIIFLMDSTEPFLVDAVRTYPISNRACGHG